MNIKPCVIGLGYVGLPVLSNLAKKFECSGFDINKKRIANLRKFSDTTNEFKKNKLKFLKKTLITYDKKKIKNCNFFIVTVPTPIHQNKKPDLKPLMDACKLLSKIIKKNDIIVFESTVYPGTTEKICIPIIEKLSSLDYKKKHFHVCFSPERINPGDKYHTIDKLNKIIAIPNKKIISTVRKVYQNLSKKLFINNNIEETETSKIIENIQRDLNIALMNEIFIFCKKIKIDFYKVLNLSSTKWNFNKYYPGLVGGHCLPVDPYYFSYIAKKNNLGCQVTLSGRNTNENMKNFLIFEIKKKMNELSINYKKEEIIFAGLTYKKNVADLRNSQALKIFYHFRKLNKKAKAIDPLVSSEKIKGLVDLKKIPERVKCVIFLVDHNMLKNTFKKIKNKIPIINIFNFFNNKNLLK